jgi:O-methyltransferase
MLLAGITHPHIYKGWFQDTLKTARFGHGIAILRMDADWYESTMQILVNLFDSVNRGGVILIDDYFTWDGCARAVHDYLSKNICAERINAHHRVCFIEKSQTPLKFDRVNSPSILARALPL